ncbi:MAG: ATP-binding protein [Lachnospiraceae bacterium]|nr:ATP-binding protein [Lachnospiraceae bacterium]
MENTELKSQLSLAQKYQNYQDEAYRKQEQSLLEMEHMAHDFKHYLASIEGMVNGSDADLSHYIGTLGKEIDQKFMQPFGFSTNRALNVILYQKQRECEKSGIEFQINIGFGDLSFINYSDTCAIFGNALDNATTACQEISDNEKEKYIKLNIHKHKDMLLISIENSKNPQQQLIEINDTIRSTKLDEGYHGFGLTNLRTAVLNYEGNVVFSYNDNSFILMVNIMLKNEYFVNKLLDKQENSSILQSQNN